MLERTLVGNIKKKLRAMGWWVEKLHGGPYQKTGLPDLLAIKHGITWFIEVKLPGNKPTIIQEKTMRDLKEAGANVMVAYSVEDVLQELGSGIC